MNDRDKESGYKWIDDSQLDYVNWQEGEPNNYGGYENCIEMQTRRGQWNDLPCNFYRPFMCKKNIGENIYMLVICSKMQISKMLICFRNEKFHTDLEVKKSTFDIHLANIFHLPCVCAVVDHGYDATG